MAVLPILTVESPILREKTKKVTRIDSSIQKLIDDMIETMRAAPGVGLAAPQVGVSIRIAVIEVEEGDIITLINPEIVKTAGERQVEEGCLSLPGYVGTITRSENVVVKARDRNGRQIRVKGVELLAQALEHELDHLDGVLYVDHLTSMDDLRKVEPKKVREEAEV